MMQSHERCTPSSTYLTHMQINRQHLCHLRNQTHLLPTLLRVVDDSTLIGSHRHNPSFGRTISPHPGYVTIHDFVERKETHTQSSTKRNRHIRTTSTTSDAKREDRTQRSATPGERLCMNYRVWRPTHCHNSSPPRSCPTSTPWIKIQHPDMPYWLLLTPPPPPLPQPPRQHGGKTQLPSKHAYRESPIHAHDDPTPQRRLGRIFHDARQHRWDVHLSTNRSVRPTRGAGNKKKKQHALITLMLRKSLRPPMGHPSLFLSLMLLAV